MFYTLIIYPNLLTVKIFMETFKEIYVTYIVYKMNSLINYTFSFEQRRTMETFWGTYVCHRLSFAV
ncbi:hypothetical protein GCM10007176_13560 [Salinicoccus roseus]|nr:hypothetical protein GCM10007176_13560 [Salinicoccus roseus]